MQFKTIWLKKLVTTHYSTDKPSYKIEVTNSNITQILPYIKNWTLFDDTEIFREFWELLTENWDFRNEECIEYLYYILLLNKDIIVAKYLQGGQGNLSAQIIKRLKYKLCSNVSLKPLY